MVRCLAVSVGVFGYPRELLYMCCIVSWPYNTVQHGGYNVALTDAWLRKAKPGEKAYKQSDGGGLYIQINVSGAKLWRLAYRYGGKQKTLSLGNYPLISLSEARAARDSAKRLLLEGLDPAQERENAIAANVSEVGETFEAVAREWHA